MCVVSSSPCEAREFDVGVRVDSVELRTLEVSGCGVALSSGVRCQFTCGEACVSCLCAFSACLHSHQVLLRLLCSWWLRRMVFIVSESATYDQ